MRVSGSRHSFDLVSSKSRITPLPLNWKSSFDYFVVTEKDLLETCCDKNDKKKEFMKLVEFFFFVFEFY